MVHQDIGLWNLPTFGSGTRSLDLLSGVSSSSIEPIVLSPRLIPSLKHCIPLVIHQSRHPFLPDPPIDCSDNDVQLQLIQHHYLSEFDSEKSGDGVKNSPGSIGQHIREVVKDYAPNSVIYKVMDEIPTMYRGRRGVEEMCREIYGQLENIELEHVAVDQNHAQVVWKGETKGPSHTTIYGRDFFTFDDKNHIVSQTIVALSQANESKK